MDVYVHTLNLERASVEVFFARKERKKRGRVLQWQTQSVMQDYSVSFSTAIDVVFIGETQGFTKCSGPCYPCSILETKAKGGGILPLRSLRSDGCYLRPLMQDEKKKVLRGQDGR